MAASTRSGGNEIESFKVDFIIPGVMKAGTTALSTYLREHPQIILPNLETRFFSLYYERGFSWYRDFVMKANSHKRDQPCMIGDKSVNYAFIEGTEERIFRYQPGMKFIWMFRDPVKRLISDYRDRYRYGGEILPFEKAIRLGKARSKSNRGLNYLETSIYAPQVARYLRYFPKEQMLFLTSDELRAAPHKTLRTVCAFLGADTEYTFRLPDERPIVNPTEARPYILVIQHLSWAYIRPLSKSLHRRIIHLNSKKDGAIHVIIDSAFEAELREYFRPFNAELAELTDLDVSGWS